MYYLVILLKVKWEEWKTIYLLFIIKYSIIEK